MLERRPQPHCAQVPNANLSVHRTGRRDTRPSALRSGQIDESHSFDALALGMTTKYLNDFPFVQRDDEDSSVCTADDGKSG